MVGSHPVPLASNKIALAAHGFRAEFAPPFVAAPQSVQQLISMPAILFDASLKRVSERNFAGWRRCFTHGRRRMITALSCHLCHLA
jgi:hypothetical protein